MEWAQNKSSVALNSLAIAQLNRLEHARQHSVVTNQPLLNFNGIAAYLGYWRTATYSPIDAIGELEAAPDVANLATIAPYSRKAQTI